MIELLTLYWFYPIIIIGLIWLLIRFPDLFLIILEVIISTILRSSSADIGSDGASGGGGSDGDY